MAEDPSEHENAGSFQLLGVFFPRKFRAFFRSVHRLLRETSTPNGWGGLLIPDWLALWREARKQVGRPHD